MKKTTITFLGFITILLAACSGSDTYRGEWKATNEQGTPIEITFGENEFSITQEEKTQKFQYTQNSVDIKNSVETYGIKLNDGRAFKIHFPIANDESKGAILDTNGAPLYIISRTDFIGYNDVYGM